MGLSPFYIADANSRSISPIVAEPSAWIVGNCNKSELGK
jgi:hypothetical protein